MQYNQLNQHPRDLALQFDEATHTYTVNGQRFRSATELISSCFPQFDAEKWAPRTARKLGMTTQQVLDMWEQKRDAAAQLGTDMHAAIEAYYMGEPLAQMDTSRLFQAFAADHQLSPYRTEWAVYDEPSRVAGTIDFLDCTDGRYTMYDWKRSEKIVDPTGRVDKVNNYGKHGFAPIAHLDDTSFWHYALQQSMYRYILEKNYGIEVDECNLVVLHPSYTRYFLIPVPYLRKEVIAIMSR